VTLGIPVARIADRFNRRNLIALSLALWSGMTMLCGFAANTLQLALARIGVGIGEAGCSPPAHSIIADLYAPNERASAMALYTLGISAGIMLAYLGGGWLADNSGWREALIVVGAPGLLLALIVRFTLEEPRRGASEQREDHGQMPSIADAARFIAKRPSFLHLAIAAGLVSFVGYSVLIFFASVLERSFELQLTSIGLWLGLILGIAGGAGFVAGGYINDFLSKKSPRLGMRFIAGSMLLACVSYALVFTASSPIACLSLYVVPAFVSNMYLAPVLAQTQSLVPLRMRALASAFMLFVINLIGLAVGPPLVGALSDYLATAFGDDSLRISLLSFSSVLMPWAAAHFWWASGLLGRDLARATIADVEAVRL